MRIGVQPIIGYIGITDTDTDYRYRYLFVSTSIGSLEIITGAIHQYQCKFENKKQIQISVSYLHRYDHIARTLVRMLTIVANERRSQFTIPPFKRFNAASPTPHKFVIHAYIGTNKRINPANISIGYFLRTALPSKLSVPWFPISS